MLGFSMPGGPEWIIILIIALLLFGARLPSVMRSLGKSVTEFKKGMREGEEELVSPVDDGAAKTSEDQPPKELKG